MMTGSVNANYEARLRLRVEGPNGRWQEINAVIDTGFTGLLTLPLSVIVSLGLTWLTQGRAMLGNGQLEIYDVYAAVAVWDGQPLRIMADEADTDPLVGMELMAGYTLNVQNFDGGLVTLQKI